MPTIHFVKRFKPLTVENGEFLMRALLKAGIPVATSCHGEGVCGKCQIHIVKGSENLSQIGTQELQVQKRMILRPEVRISCQTQVLGDILIDTPYW